MRVKQLTEYLKQRGGYGASLTDIQAHFEAEGDEAKRVIESAINLDEVKKAGKGRGVKYYLAEVDIIETKDTNNNGVVEGNEAASISGIDLTGCITTKDKIKRIMNSDKPLTQLIELSYTEDLLDKETGRKLVDFIKGGYKLITVGLMFNNQEKKYWFPIEERCEMVRGAVKHLKNVQVDFGIAGGSPDEAAKYIVMTHMSFESIEAFQNIFAVHSEELLSDIANFTNCQPVLQISEIKI